MTWTWVHWRGLLQALAVVLAAIVVLTAAGLVALSHGPGRGLVRSVLDGREIDGVGVVTIEGLRGNVLGAFSIARLTMADQDGVWLVAENIAVGWRPRSMAQGPIRVDSLVIDRLRIDRRPVLPPRQQDRADSGSFSGVLLGDGRVRQLELAEGVAGAAAHLEAYAEIALRTGHPGQVALAVTRLDAPGDALEANFEITGTGHINGRFEASGAAGGPFSELLRVPGDSIHISAAMDGDRRSGEGAFSIILSGQDVAGGQLDWADQAWQVDSDIRANNWANLPDTLAPLVAGARITANGSLQDGRIASASLRSDSIDADIRPGPDGDWLVGAEVRGAAISHLTQGQASAQRLGFEGIAGLDPRYYLDGNITIDEAGTGSIRLVRTDGSLRLEYGDDRILASGSLALSGLTGVETATELLGDSAELDFELWAELETQSFHLTSANLRAEHLTVQADGEYDIRADTRRLNANIAIDDLARFTSQARGPVTASITTTRNNEFQIDLDGRALQSDAPLAGFLETLTVAATVRREELGWTLPAISLRTSSLSAEAEAGIGPDGDWDITGDLAIAGQFAGSALGIDGGLATGFELHSRAGQITAQTATVTNALSLGDTRLTEPRLAMSAQYGDDGLSASWALTGQSGSRPVNLNGQVNQVGDGWTLALDESSIGTAGLLADADITGDVLTLTARAGLTERWSITADYTARLDALLDGSLDARLAIRNLAVGAMVVSEVQLSLIGPASNLVLEAQAAGQAGVPFEISASGLIALAESGMQTQLTASGQLGANRWQTTEPMRGAIDSESRSLHTALEFGGGQLTLDWQEAEGVETLTALVGELPVALLVDLAGLPAIDGVISAAADLQRSNGAWRGDASVTARQLSAASLSDAPELVIETHLTLADDARIDSVATSGGLSAHAYVTRPGLTAELRDVLGGPDGAISGGLEADGEILALSSLILPVGTTLSGLANIRLAVTGTRQAPNVEGQVQLNQGRFSVADTGTDILDITFAARVNNSAGEIETFTAHDGVGGQLSAQGSGHVTAQGPRGTAVIEYTSFTAMRRPDLTARMSGETSLALSDTGLLVSGETRLERVYAQPPANGTAAIPELEVIELNAPKNHIRASRARLPIQLDYRVYATDQIYFNSSSFNTEWRADIAITGRANKPTLSGTAEIVRGSATVFNRRFSLESGQVQFNGRVTDARISLIARHQRPDFQARVEVSGPLLSPAVSLSSEPSLPEDEIISRLLFDRQASELGPFEAAQLAAQLSGQDALDVVGRLRGMIGVDRLDIGSAADGSLTITSGRRFGNDFYVEVESGGDVGLSAARVEWSLTPDLSILSRLSADTEASVAIRWRREY